MTRKLTRRSVLAGSAAMATGAYSLQVRAAPEAQKITPALIEAAKKEGKLSWYTSVDLPVAERIAKGFEAAYPGVTMKVERSGAERIFQRIGQEAQSKISNCDVVNSSDAAHLIIWKRAGVLAPFLPEEVAHIAGAHSGEGELLVRSLEGTIVHLADIGYWTMALAGGLVRPETVSSKYRRPIVL